MEYTLIIILLPLAMFLLLGLAGGRLAPRTAGLPGTAAMAAARSPMAATRPSRLEKIF